MPADVAAQVTPKPEDVTPKPDATQEDSPIAGEESLADAGKQALDRMKAERNKFRDEAKAAAEERDRVKAEAEGRLAEYEAEKTAREAGDKRFHERLFGAELRAAGAAEQVKHPEMLERLISARDFPLDAEGNLDPSAIREAVKTAITQYDLATAATARFQGNADAGPRNAEAKSEEQQLIADIAKAEAARNVPASIALKQRLTQLRATQ
jgi:hypothetical protein